MLAPSVGEALGTRFSSHNGSQGFTVFFCWLVVVSRLKLPSGSVDMSISQFGHNSAVSNFSYEQFKDAILKVKEHILAGDIFQLVLSQRFERRTFADPFEIYRALRIVNPSPYMIYLQVHSMLSFFSCLDLIWYSQFGHSLHLQSFCQSKVVLALSRHLWHFMG